MSEHADQSFALVIAVGESGREMATVNDTGLNGAVLFNNEVARWEYVLPFRSIDNAIDCLMVVIGSLKRDADE